MNKNKKSIWIVIALVIIVIVGAVLVSNFQDRQKFIEASRNVYNLADQISTTSPKTVQQYCLRNNIKYEKGTLSCMTEINFIVNPSSSTLPIMDEKVLKFGWVSRGSNLSSWKNADESYIYAKIYNGTEMDCYTRVKDQNKKYEVTIGCYASARRAWYPVKNE